MGAALSGLIAGLSAGAAGLALIGRPLLELEPDRVKLLLVVGPLLGLWPAALLSFVAAHSVLVRGWTAALLGLWAACAAVATVWFGLLDVLR